MGKNLVNGLFSAISDAELAAMAMRAEFEASAVSNDAAASQLSETGSADPNAATALDASVSASRSPETEDPSGN